MGRFVTRFPSQVWLSKEMVSLGPWLPRLEPHSSSLIKDKAEIEQGAGKEGSGLLIQRGNGREKGRQQTSMVENKHLNSFVG